MTLSQPSSNLSQLDTLRARRRANSLRIAHYRSRKRRGLSVFKIELADADVSLILRSCGLSERASKPEIERRLARVLSEMARRR